MTALQQLLAPLTIMQAYTPGPWTAEGEDIIDANDKRVSSVQGLFRSKAEVTANAALIASAPELLDALQVLQAAVKTFVNGHEDWPEMQAAVKAIAKATL